MRTSMGRGILLVTLILGLVGVAAAQYAPREWAPENGVPYRQGYHVEWFRSMTSGDVNGDGYSLVAWSDTRSGDRDIYAQLIDASGNEQWAEEGVLVARMPVTRQEDPHVMPTSDGNWILTWIDYRYDYDILEFGDVFMQKIDMNGNILWPEGDPDYGGVPVSVIEGTREIAVQSFDDGEGGAVSVWVTDRNTNGDIYAMHMLANGTPDPDWDVNGNMLAGGPENQADVESIGYTADTDGNGGIIAGWVDERNPNNAGLYANRINADGDLVWADSSGIPICIAEGSQGKFRMAPDGLGGAYFMWRDQRDVNNPDIYGQHVQAEGTVDWTVDGELVVYEHADSTAMDPSDVRIVNTGEGEAIIVWTETQVNDQVYDLRAQRLSLGQDNALVLNWGVDGSENRGVVVCDAADNQEVVRLSPDGSGGAVFVWEDERDGNESIQNLFAQRLDVDGDPVWGDPNGIVVCDAIQPQIGAIGRVVGDNFAFVWQDYRRGSPGLYYQYVSMSAGTTLLEENGIQIVFGIDGNAKTPSIIYDPDYEEYAWLAWVDGRWGSLGRVPFMQKIEKSSGEAQLASNGVSLIPRYPFGGDEVSAVSVDSLAIIPDGNGGFYAGWEDSRAPYSTVLAFQHVNADGELQWSDEGLAFEPNQFFGQYRPSLLARPEGGLYAFHDEESEGFIMNAKLEKIDADGTIGWPGEDDTHGIWITEDSRDNRVEAFTYFDNDDSDILMVYQRNAGAGNTDLHAACYSTVGDSVKWVIDICTAERRQSNAQVAIVNDGILVVWEDQRVSTTDINLYGQIINFDGTLRWEENGRLLIDNDASQFNFELQALAGYYIWLVWEDTRNETNDIYAQWFNIHGAPQMTPADGKQLTADAYDKQRPRLIVDNQVGATFAWESAAGASHIDLYATHIRSDGTVVTEDGYQEMDGGILCDAYHIQSIIDLASDGENGALATWQDLRATGKEFLINIYGQRIPLWTGVGEELTAATPQEWELSAAYPNPFNPSTQLGFFLPNNMNVSLTVYDVLGRQVKQLVNGTLDAGRHMITWDGTDFSGRQVASGTYFYRLEHDGNQLVRKMVLMK